MANDILNKSNGEWDYIHDEIIDRINRLTIECPECETIHFSDDQYQCGTCGGGGIIHVGQWIKQQ